MQDWKGWVRQQQVPQPTPACGTALFLHQPWGQLSAGLCTKPGLLPALANGSEMAPLVAVPRISSPQHRYWVSIALVRAVKALGKAQHSFWKTLKCHSAYFRQELCFVFHIRQFPSVWAFTGEWKPMMHLFLPRISIRNLDLASVHRCESKWEMEHKSLRRRDFLKWKDVSLQRKTSAIPSNWITNQKGWEVKYSKKSCYTRESGSSFAIHKKKEDSY